MEKPPLALVPAAPAETTTPDHDEILTPIDIERRYAIKLGTQKSMRSRGMIPFIRLGTKLIRYRKSSIEAWVNSSAVPVRK